MSLPFILASSSPRRRELLASLGISFEVLKPSINEALKPDEPPLDYVRRLSVEKAAAVAQQIKQPSIIIAADTVVICDDLILGKPEDEQQARDMLNTLRARDHQVCTSVTLLVADRLPHTELTCTRVTMRDYTDAEIDAYIATGDPFDKAGGYAIQHPDFAPAAAIDGSYTNVVGLPLETLRLMLVNVLSEVNSNG